MTAMPDDCSDSVLVPTVIADPPADSVWLFTTNCELLFWTSVVEGKVTWAGEVVCCSALEIEAGARGAALLEGAGFRGRVGLLESDVLRGEVADEVPSSGNAVGLPVGKIWLVVADCVTLVWTGVLD
jgi:hypothetical protein